LTGEIGAKPLVILSKDTEVIQRFIAPVLKGVLCLAISPEGKLGVCVGMDDYHEVAVVDLRTGEVRMKAKGGR
jgi:tricorn protease-like protein